MVRPKQSDLRWDKERDMSLAQCPSADDVIFTYRSPRLVIRWTASLDRSDWSVPCLRGNTVASIFKTDVQARKRVPYGIKDSLQFGAKTCAI